MVRGEDQSGPCLVIWVKIYEYTETNDVCFKNGKMKALRFQMGFTVRFQTMGKIFGHKIENKWMLKFFAALKYPWVRSGIKLSSSDMNVSVKHLYLSLITTFLFLYLSQMCLLTLGDWADKSRNFLNSATFVVNQVLKPELFSL